jgi:hypothetical protein
MQMGLSGKLVTQPNRHRYSYIVPQDFTTDITQILA